jgi:hypothetical protein
MTKDMQHQLDGIKCEMSAVKHNLAIVDQRLGTVETTLRNVVVEQSRARGDIEWLKENSVTRGEFKSGLDLILTRIDGLAGKFEDSRYGSAKNADRIDDHERRISAIEAKRA